MTAIIKTNFLYEGPAISGQKIQAHFHKVTMLHDNESRVKGTKIEGYCRIQGEKQAVLGSIMKHKFQRCFYQWDRCWAQCMSSEQDITNI
jgi:hypothetical protein